MEPAPTMNVSRPTTLRLLGFLLSAIGALLAGISPALTWVTVGLRNQPQLSPEIPGLDIVDGKIVLVAAVVMLVGVIATRLVAPGARKVIAIAILVAAIVVVVVAATFLVRATDRFEAVDSEVLIEKIAEAKDLPVDTVRGQMERAVAQLGEFTDVGSGPWLALAGGIVATAGGVFVVAWSRRTASPDETAEHEPPTEPG
jgi:energy-converting hydrogenase Eha subunit C